MGRIDSSAVEEALQPLLGLPLWAAGRAADLEWLQFGGRRTVTDSRGTKEVGDFALHLQCPWRLLGPDGIVTGRGDLWYAAGDPEATTDDFRYDVQGANRCDEKTAMLAESLDRNRLVVESILVGLEGAFALDLSGDYRIEVFPYNSVDHEHWRLFVPYNEAPHFVVCGDEVFGV